MNEDDIERFVEDFITEHDREPTELEIEAYVASAYDGYDDYIDSLIDEAKLND